MAISFNTIPSGIKNPGTYAEIDNSQAVTGVNTQDFQGLILGQKIAAGTQAADTIELITSPEDAKARAGEGSIAHLMAKSWFAAQESTALYIGLLADNGTGFRVMTVTITGPATASGAMYLYVNGQLITVNVADTDTETAIAAALAAAITAASDVPFTAVAALGVITLTAINAGEVSNEIDVRFNYDNANQAFPAGVTGVVAETTPGVLNPVLTDIITAMGDEKYNIIASPYLDTTSLTALRVEMDRRFGPLVDKAGAIITCKRDSVANLVSFGSGLNSEFLTVGDTDSSPTSSFEMGAQWAAQVAFYAANDPARPFQTLALPTVLPAIKSDARIASERETLMSNGIATTKITVGVVRINRTITTYQTSPAGADDVSFFDVNTLLTLDFLRNDFKTFWTNKYPRHKLADDGTRFGAGQAVMTPSVGKSEAVNRFQLWEELGLVENLAQFKAGLIVERSLSDRSRLDFSLPTDIINQLRVTGVIIPFIL